MALIHQPGWLVLAGLLVPVAVHAQGTGLDAVLPAPQTGPSAPQPPSALQQQQLRAARALAPRATAAVPYQVDTTSREAVRLFYKTVFMSSDGVPSGWTGNVATCTAGTVSAAYQDASLRRINWYRAMAGVPAGVTLDATFNRKAQQAALMMSAQNQLSHFPGANWACHSAEGAEAAANSNLALGRAGPNAVAQGYVRDDGANNAAVGHRRWLLYPQTRVMGVGDASPERQAGGAPANAVWVFDDNFGAARPAVRDDFVAWPPPGFVPYTTVYPRWSLSYPGADFSAATVAMTENGSPIATRLEPVSNGAGEPTLVWFPGAYADGAPWVQPAQDTRYSVTVGNVRVGAQVRSFRYEVTVFDPEVTGSDTPILKPQGASLLAPGQAGRFTFAGGVPASEHQWRSVAVVPHAVQEGAEGPTLALTPTTNAGYSVVDAELAASGSRSLHLAHVAPVDQVLLLDDVLVPGPSARVRFASRLGLSSPQQVALVEVSVDEGRSWQVLYRQAGQQSGSTSTFGESSFTERSLSLAAYADRVIRLRWRYALASGSYYPQATRGIGWYVDDIAITGVDRLAGASLAQVALGGAFEFSSTEEGTALLQVRAGLFGHYDGWGPALRVSVGTGATAAQLECLFQWAERQLPALLAPAAATRTDIPPFSYRHYTASNSYVGVSAADQRVYYLPPGGALQDLGLVSGWLTSAACR